MTDRKPIDLSGFCQTRTEVEDLGVRLAAVSESVYQDGFEIEKDLLDKLGLERKDKILGLARDNNIDLNSAVAVKEFLDRIAEEIAELPVVTLTVAFDPTEESLDKISDWFLLNFQNRAVFDLKTDPAIIGGAVISYNGKFKDLSLVTRFETAVNDVLGSSTSHG